MNNALFIALAVLSVTTALIFLGLLIWGAVEDGRDQDRRDPTQRK